MTEWTDTQDEILVRGIMAGNTDSQMATFLNRPRAAIQGRWKRLKEGLPRCFTCKHQSNGYCRLKNEATDLTDSCRHHHEMVSA